MKCLSQSPTDPAFVQNPYPFYAAARKTGPLFYWQDYKMPCAVSHSAVTAVLKNKKLGRETPDERVQSIPDHVRPFYDIEAHSMLELEPPRHTRLRGLVLRAFTSRRIASLEPEIETLCHELVDRFPSDPFDLLRAYGRHVPAIIICRLLGVPERDVENLLKWSNAMVAMYMANRTRTIEDSAAEASLAFRDYIQDQISRKRARPGDDLLSELIAAEQDGQKLSNDEMVTTCILLLNAGHEATVHTIGNGVATLLSHGVTEVTASTVEEILRFDPPLHMFTRWVYEEVEIEGQVFRRGDQLACLLAAANRDPVAYADPDDFRPGRNGPVNTSFGAGSHFCVGAPLARLELLVALRVLFQRCPNLRLSEPPRYADIYHFHGLERLMVSL